MPEILVLYSWIALSPLASVCDMVRQFVLRHMALAERHAFIGIALTVASISLACYSWSPVANGVKLQNAFQKGSQQLTQRSAHQIEQHLVPHINNRAAEVPAVQHPRILPTSKVPVMSVIASLHSMHHVELLVELMRSSQEYER